MATMMSSATIPIEIAEEPSNHSGMGFREALSTGLRAHWWAYIVVPIVLATILVLLEIVDIARPISVLRSLGYATATSLAVGLSLTMTHAMVLSRWPRSWPQGVKESVAIYIIAGVGGLIVGGELALHIAGLFYPNAAPSFIRTAIWGSGAVVVVLVGCIGMSIDHLRERARETERRQQIAKQATLRAELAALQARTNPHFLFNSLNLIIDLIEESPSRAIEAAERLADLLRYGMRGADALQVRLSEELDAVRDYLELQSWRFGNRLRYRFCIEEGIEDAQVLPLMLQPLVENSVNHGVATSISGAEVELRVHRSAQWLRIVLRDTGVGPSRSGGNKSAHENLRARLAMVYNDQASFEAGPGEHGGYRVVLQLPYQSSNLAYPPAAPSHAEEYGS